MDENWCLINLLGEVRVVLNAEGIFALGLPSSYSASQLNDLLELIKIIVPFSFSRLCV